MALVSLDAKMRLKTSKGDLKKIRGKGYVPGVVYGQKMENRLVQVPIREIERILKSSTALNTLIELKLKNNEQEEKYNVIIGELQKHPFKNEYLHADFKQISLTTKLEVEVPIHLSGEAAGVEEGGVLQYGLRFVTVACLPTDIPENIDVDISSLEIGDKITVGDLKENIKYDVLSESESVIISVVAIQEEEEPAVDEGEEELSDEEQQEATETETETE